MESKRPTADRARQQKWRDQVGEIEYLVHEVSPRIFEDNARDRLAELPPEWIALVASMRADVHAETDREKQTEGVTLAERRGYQWNYKVGRVADLVRHLLQTIAADIDLGEDQVLATMVLVHKAFFQLKLELQDLGTREGRDDRDEQRYRVLGALRSLTRHFDGPDLLRLRALVAGENAARFTIPPPSDEEVEQRLEEIEQHGPLTEAEREHDREFMAIKAPVLNGVVSRSWLMEVDPRFGTLDPLVVMEEFAEAQAKARGGRNGGGEPRTGPARAVARLALMCGALDAAQREGEDFDQATERLRGALLNSRSRIRATMREFPGHGPEQPTASSGSAPNAPPGTGAPPSGSVGNDRRE